MLEEIQIESLLEEIKNLPFDKEEVAPVAFFDADHTLWAGDLGDLIARTAMNHNMLKPEAQGPVAEILKRSNGTPSNDPNRDSQLLMEHYFRDEVEEIDIISAQVICYAGWTTQELFDFSQKLFDEHFAPKIYEDMARLHDALRAAGIDIKVISGSPQWVVEAACERLDIVKEDVYGARAVLDGDKITGVMEPPITYKDGKVGAMRHWVGDKIGTIAFGDSKSDYPMQERCMIRVAVNPRPGVRKYASENDPDSWRLWVPNRTKDGHTVERIETDRVITE
jgi:HAD superfamily phosphoserine phosphatase-like hydrolase